MTAYFCSSSYSRIVSVMFIKSFEVLFTASLLCMYIACIFFKGNFGEPYVALKLHCGSATD